MFDRWELGIGALLGAALLVVGIAIRTGHFRRGVGNTYFNRALPRFQRQAVFALIPGGLAFLSVALAFQVDPHSFERGNTSAQDPIATILVLFGIVCLAAFFWWMFRPPAWTKPAWVREYERAERAGEPVPDLRAPPMSQRAYTLNWIGLFAMAAGWLALGLPIGPLLIGLGFGMSALFANRPRRQA